MKSCQAVPVTFPGSGFASAAGAAPSGILSGATPTSGSSTGSPARAGSRVVKEPPSLFSSGDFGPGWAFGKAEDSLKVSWTATQAALATPRSGSCS